MGSHFRMKTAVKICMLLGIFMITLVEPKDDLDIIVKEMMMEMNGRMLLLEAELKTTKEELTATKEELKLTATKEELKLTATKEELSVTRDDLTSKDHELERDLSIIRNPPFIHSCGSISRTKITSQTLRYSKLLYSSTNTEGGGLDIATGVFTSPWPGSYTVTWSLYAGDGAVNSQVQIYLRQNGQNIGESLHASGYSGPSGSYVDDQGGRTLVLHLDMGDTLDLYCQDCSARI